MAPFLVAPVVKPRRAAAADGPSVTLSATTGIVDGQAVTVTITTTPDYQASFADASLCRDGVTYAESAPGSRFPANDFVSDGPNCPGPSHAVSSSSDSFVSDANVSDNATKPGGETFIFRVGSGETHWTQRDGTEETLTCDEQHACDLVVELRQQAPGAASPVWHPYVFKLTYGSTDPIKACNGPADGVLQTGGSDRMTEAWIALTLGACAQPGAKGAPGKAVFLGEGQALEQFALSNLDLVYSAGGYDKDMAMIDPTIVPSDGIRPHVAIPVALNAAVLAVGGGYIVDASHKSPYKSLKFTADWAAEMISGNEAGIEQQNAPDSTADHQQTYAQEIAAANPEIADHGGYTGIFDHAAGMTVGASADAEAFSWYASRYFKALAPTSWKVPNLPSQDQPGTARDVYAAYGTAKPSFPLTLMSSRANLLKNLQGPTNSTQGGVYVLTDLATATAVGLPPVQIPDKSGAFVAPNAASMQAAVPLMKEDDEGILISDPTKAAASGAQAVYPMTMVEYAIVPTEPLYNDDCTPRTAGQKLLSDWLTYITSADGQSKLPSGLAPLPDNLKTVAADRIKKVGTAPLTGPCAASASKDDKSGAQETTTTTTPAAAAATDTNSTPVPSAPLEDVTGAGPQMPIVASTLANELALPSLPGASASSAPEVVNPPPETALVEALARIPPFGGRRIVSWFGAAFALAGIVALSTMAMFSAARSRS